MQKQRKQGPETDQRSAEQPKATEEGLILVGQKVAEESEHSSPKLTHEQMLAAFDSYETKSMDEYKKIIDLTEEEEEKLENEEPEEELDNQEEEQEKDEQQEKEQEEEEREIENLGNCVLTILQLCSCGTSGARMEVASPIQQLSKNQLQQELC